MIIYYDKFTINLILNYLKGDDIFNLIKTSRKFSYLLKDDIIWKKLLKIHYNWDLKLKSYIDRYIDLYKKITYSSNYCFYCDKHSHFYNYVVLCSCYSKHKCNLINIHQKCMLKMNHEKIVSRIDPEILYFVINCPLCNNLSRCFVCTGV